MAENAAQAGRHLERRPRRRGGAAFPTVLAVVASLLLVSALVLTGSRAIFTGSTDNADNAFSLGTVDLVDDDLGSARFSVTLMEPGQSVTDCILVTYQGTIVDPSAVKIYSGGYTDSAAVGANLNITIEEGTGGSFGSCTGFTLENTIESLGTLVDFDATHTNYATGAGVWDPVGTPESKTYRITVELDAATPDSEQGQSVTALTFNWEIQN